MTTGYSRSPKVQKGALIELGEQFIGPIPNIIPFQYNPESVTRSLTPWEPPAEEEGASSGDAQAQPFDPQETINLSLELDATDYLEQPSSNPVGSIFGVADRIAAIEKLLYPVTEGALGGLGAAISSLVSGEDTVPRTSAPVVLLVWGLGRIVPVRVTSYQIEEQAFLPSLYPIRAKVTLGFMVLTPSHFEKPGKTLSLSEEIAVTSYRFTFAQKELLARAGLLSNLDSILGILPF